VRYARSQNRSGKSWVVDLDLDAIFDRVNHSRLLRRLYCHLPERGLIQLLNRYLKAGVMIDGQRQATVEGVPQGGPLSPVLSNVVLDERDWELHRRGHAFARYADDAQVYVGSRTAGELAWNTAKPAHGPWRIRHSPALYLALPTRDVRGLGLPELAAR